MARGKQFGAVEVQGQYGEDQEGGKPGASTGAGEQLNYRQKRILDSQYGNRMCSCTLIFRIGIVLEK